MASDVLLMPGDEVASHALPKNNKKPLVLGPGLRHALPSSVQAVTAGTLAADPRKNAIWIDHNGGRVRLMTFVLLDCLLTSGAIVHSPCQRPNHRNSASLFTRHVPLQHHTSRFIGQPTATSIRRRDKEDTSTTCSRRVSVCTDQRSEPGHGSRAGVRLRFIWQSRRPGAIERRHALRHQSGVREEVIDA